MEYIDMVGQIIAAEHRAKALAQEGARRGEELRAGLEQEKASLRESCLARAKTRVEMARQAEQAKAERKIARLDEAQRQALARMEEVYEKNRAGWTDTLFTMITGVEP